ncbi:hypothetical protein ACJJTC_009863 [Scirpophaga incertulas]
MPKTRKDLRCPMFGDPQKLGGNMLPTYSDNYSCMTNELIAKCTVDKVMTQSIQRGEIRKRKYDQFVQKSMCAPSTSSSASNIIWTSDSSSIETESNEDDIIMSTEKKNL